MGSLIILAILASGSWLSYRGLGLRGAAVFAIGPAVAGLCSLFSLTLMLQSGLQFKVAVWLAPLSVFFLALWGHFRPANARTGSEMSKREVLGIALAVVLVWLFTNLMQTVTVDDDYWLHTPVQFAMSRGEFPPTNPYFPDLILGGHFSRDLLIVSVSTLTGRDIFGAQVLVTSFCHALGLAVLYLGLRGQAGIGSAVGGCWLAWFGMNVSGRVGLIDFFQNNGALVYLTVALLGYLFAELWRRPEPRYCVLTGTLRGFSSLVYESHFGLMVLTLVSLLGWLDRALWRPTLVSLGIAGVLALTGGGAISRLAMQKEPLDQAVANQSQTVQLSVPKSPFLSLRIERWEPGPVSIGYRSGLGSLLLPIIDREPQRVDDYYVRIFGWMVLRMHWLGVWLAPLSALIVWNTRNRLGQFLWLFGMWAFLVPGIVNFGAIHEYEWYRWEFAAGFGFAGAAGAALGTFATTKRSAVALSLGLLLFSDAGLRWTWHGLSQLSSVPLGEVLGLRFSTRSWLLRHGKHLRIEESDLRSLAWIDANPEQGGRTLFLTTGSTDPWDILFESTAMGLTEVRAVGHRLPLDTDAIGLPPYRRLSAVDDLLKTPTVDQARALGADWIYLRSDDVQLEARLIKAFPLVYLDGLSWDGKRRYLFRVPAAGEMPPALSVPDVDAASITLREAPKGTVQVGLTFEDSRTGQVWNPSPLQPFSVTFALGIPPTADTLRLSFHGSSKILGTKTVGLKNLRRP